MSFVPHGLPRGRGRDPAGPICTGTLGCPIDASGLGHLQAMGSQACAGNRERESSSPSHAHLGCPGVPTCRELSRANTYWKTTACLLTASTPKTQEVPRMGSSTATALAVSLKGKGQAALGGARQARGPPPGGADAPRGEQGRPLPAAASEELAPWKEEMGAGLGPRG